MLLLLLLLFELLLLLDGFEVEIEVVAVTVGIGSHFVSIVRSFGETHFTFAIFFTGSLLFRFDVLFSDGFFMPACCCCCCCILSALLLLFILLLLLLDDETDRTGIAELVDGDFVVLSLSLDKLVGSGVVSLFGSVFGIFGDCTKGESVLGMRGVK